MGASLRWKNFMLGGLLLLPSVALAQNAPDSAPSNPAATGAIGPQELQNFSLPGNVTKPADKQPESTSVGASPAATSASPRDGAARATARAEPKELVRNTDARRTGPRPALVPPSKPSSEASSGVGGKQDITPQASLGQAPAIAPPLESSSFPAPPSPNPSATIGSDHRLLIWPWLLAALALVGGTFFLLWRRRQLSAFAGGPEIDLFRAPEPVGVPPAPAPASPRAPAPPTSLQPKELPRSKPASVGIVSTRLRPLLEVDARPLRCLVEEGRVVVEFELELFNSGTAPARAVLAEASLFNAGANQEQELAAFFANPVGAGERLDAVPPMKRVTFINQVIAPREAIQEYELGGRKVFVPVIAFNALYSWSAGEAQTSAAYLVGRDTAGEKLGPLSLDRGPRQIGKLAARPLTTAVRT
ncbi:MAG TPA: hypothetical protein VGU01_09900 [Sphingomicrobium sp.]|nr:hypothetical protein [Sphingomicrobium sp.]